MWTYDMPFCRHMSVQCNNVSLGNSYHTRLAEQEIGYNNNVKWQNTIMGSYVDVRN